jgi:hypothetical protein
LCQGLDRKVKVCRGKRYPELGGIVLQWIEMLDYDVESSSQAAEQVNGRVESACASRQRHYIVSRIVVLEQMDDS